MNNETQESVKNKTNVSAAESKAAPSNNKDIPGSQINSSN